MTSSLQDMSEGKFSPPVPGDLVRPRYAPGLILEDSDLAAAVDYTAALSRLLFRSLFGCGVVCGLKVTVEAGDDLAVTVAPGLALTGCGDPLQLTRSVTVSLSRQDGVLAAPATPPTTPQRAQLWVVLRGDEERFAQRELVSDPDEIDGVKQATRVRGRSIVGVLFKAPACLCQATPNPGGAADPANSGAAAADWRKQHMEQVDCAPDGGCGAGCDCASAVLLARLIWSPTGWTALHDGARRFLRPVLGDDPVKVGG